MVGDGMLGTLLAEQMAQMREIFSAFDSDQDGLLDPTEVGTVMELCGMHMSQAEVSRIEHWW
eukprot:scaffold126209_cov42-Tisochrysis_lutea.AAC.2